MSTPITPSTEIVNPADVPSAASVGSGDYFWYIVGNLSKKLSINALLTYLGNFFIVKTSAGQPNGVATLNSVGNLDSSQIPPNLYGIITAQTNPVGEIISVPADTSNFIPWNFTNEGLIELTDSTSVLKISGKLTNNGLIVNSGLIILNP